MDIIKKVVNKDKKFFGGSKNGSCFRSLAY